MILRMILVRRKRAEGCLIIFISLVLPTHSRAGFELLLFFRVRKANLNASSIFPNGFSMEFLNDLLADVV